MKYVYPAIFTREDNVIYVNFPDIENCFTDGHDLSQALENAQDVLSLTLCGIEDDGIAIPQPTAIESIVVNDNQFVNFIQADTVDYRRFYRACSVRKSLTIPTWLNQKAEQSGINFSQLLQEALKKQLNV
ncbi:MAG: type II toxin-antitoxin system HicB family antitoxin [Clostridiales bacterium]|jgi:predicted RNase H-like HicB family nuclease|nr:type II toxin-antitoxin system HicB family antitoxin [Clostridiales bacterium]